MDERASRDYRVPAMSRTCSGIVRMLAVVTVLFAGWTTGAWAQRPTRSGFWIENGVGTGAARNACSGCEETTVAYGSASHVRLGGALSHNVLLGLEVFAFDGRNVLLTSDGSPVEAENASIAAIALWYPGGSAVFLKGGAGLARGTFSVTSSEGDVVTTHGTGSGLTFGLGLDVPVFRWFALTANFGTYVAAIGDIELDGAVVDDVIATIYEAGLSLTIR
jgi:hypothetical protein